LNRGHSGKQQRRERYKAAPACNGVNRTAHGSGKKEKNCLL
jgi:hypothetical protein